MLKKALLHVIHRAKRQVSSLLASVDHKSSIDPKAALNRFAKIRNSSVGRFSYIGPRTKLENVRMGSFCSVSWDCHIGLASHPINFASTSPIFYEKHNGTGSSWVNSELPEHSARKTTVGHDVWIGAKCIVLEGVQIGHGAIIAAGSVVTKDVEPYAIVGGFPRGTSSSVFRKKSFQRFCARSGGMHQRST